MTKREFHGEAHYKWLLQQYEAIRIKRKNRPAGKPDAYDRLDMEIDKTFETFYRSQL